MEKILALDLGGTSLKLGLFDGEDIVKTEDKKHNYTGSDLEPVKKDILARINSFLSGEQISAIGIGIAGLIAPDDSLYRSTVFPSVIGFNLAKYLSKTFGVPVSIDNDADCGAWGEYYFKKGDFFYVVLGHGIGSAFVRKNGELPYKVRFKKGTKFDENKNPLPNDLGLRVLISKVEAFPIFAKYGVSVSSVDKAFDKLISPDYSGKFRIAALGSPRALRNLLEAVSGGDFKLASNLAYYETFIKEKELSKLKVDDLMVPYDSAISIAELAKFGEPNSKKAYELMGEFLGYGLLKAVDIIKKDYSLEPEIRIAGPIMNDGNLFFPAVKEYLAKSGQDLNVTPAISFLNGENPNLRGVFFKAKVLLDGKLPG
jgi:predicted NBD/HSP70 family sugar kinase